MTEPAIPAAQVNPITCVKRTLGETSGLSARAPAVILMGASLGTGNRGVSALGASLVHLLHGGHRGGTTVSMLLGRRTSDAFALRTGDRVLSIRVLNFRLSPRAGFQKNLFVWFTLACLYRALPLVSWRAFLRQRHPLIRASVEASVVGDIRGGDSFSDIYGLRNFLLGSLPVLAVLMVRGEIVLFPQTYGPYKSPWALAVARFILRRASIILSRDRESMATVAQMTGQTDRCQFCPDVAFSLEARIPEKLWVEPPLPPSAFQHSASRSQFSKAPSSAPRPPSSWSKLIGLNVNGLMYNGGYTRKNMFGLRLDYPQFLVQLVERLLADPNQHVLLVPHTFAPPQSVESDPAACRQVRAQLSPELQKRVHLVEGEYDQGEIKAVIGLCDFFIGSRMHACIAALSQGIPAIGVAYSKKFSGVFETVGAEASIIDGRDFEVEPAVDRAMELYAQRETTRSILAVRVPQAQNTLQETFHRLAGMADQSGSSASALSVMASPPASPQPSARGIP